LPSERKGLIIVKGYLKDKDIYLEVIDNGVGIEVERLKEINQILKGEKIIDDEKQYFGLRNVNQRLKLKFGEEYGLTIESEKGVKTRSIIKIGARGGETNV